VPWTRSVGFKSAPSIIEARISQSALDKQGEALLRYSPRLGSGVVKHQTPRHRAWRGGVRVQDKELWYLRVYHTGGAKYFLACCATESLIRGTASGACAGSISGFEAYTRSSTATTAAIASRRTSTPTTAAQHPFDPLIEVLPSMITFARSIIRRARALPAGSARRSRRRRKNLAWDSRQGSQTPGDAPNQCRESYVRAGAVTQRVVYMPKHGYEITKKIYKPDTRDVV
jgi:hypothetical protein